MQEKEFKALLEKYENGTANEEETAFIESWYLQYREKENAAYPDEEKADHANEIWAALQPVTREKPIKPMWTRIAAAASVLIILSAGGYFLTHREKPKQQEAALVVPGSKKAILVLANGQQISLTDAHSGALAQQGKVNITKTADGEVVYQGSDDDQITYNTIKTPRGGFYPLQMADGTIAVLDAGSSIKYPVNFKDGQDRLVEVTGQVYFKVKHNAKQPFKIKAKGQTIEDIGTQFNVSAYDDEPMRTTLVEGAVKVQNIMLKPGEQSDGITKRKVTIEDVIAWKNGQTSFEGETVQEIMNQVSRWYDVDIIYQGNQPTRHFTGGISRKASFSELQKVLSYNNIHVVMDGKKLLVKP